MPDQTPPQPSAPPAQAEEYQPSLDPSAKACGNCRLWRAHSRNEQGAWVGNCRVLPGRGLFPPEAPVCSSYLPRAAAIPTALPQARSRTEHARPLGQIAPTVVRKGAALGPAHAPHLPTKPDVDLGEDFDMTREELKAIIREALGEADVQLAPKWEGGTVLLKPKDPALQPRELPIDALLHKVVMVRDRLRVLEQKINAHAKLSDAEKVEMQQYVTKCYGSLTSFNVLFHDKRDHFVGDKGGGE